MSDTMVSRSLRIKPATLKVLQAEADDQGMGITVYIRTVLEKHVESLEFDDNLAAWEQDLLGTSDGGTLF